MKRAALGVLLLVVVCCVASSSGKAGGPARSSCCSDVAILKKAVNGALTALAEGDKAEAVRRLESAVELTSEP